MGVGLLPQSGVAQPTAQLVAEPRPELVDRIAAVVDDEVILQSEVDETVWLYRIRAGISPQDTTGLIAFRRDVLNQLIDEKLLVAKAQREGIVIGTKELSMSLDWAIEEMRRSFGSDEDFLAELKREGTDLQSLKDRYRNTVRQQILARKVMEQELRSNVPVQPEEVREFYDTHRDSIPRIPEQLEMLAVLVRVQMSEDARDAARLRAEAVLAMIRDGRDFTEAAMEFSDGPEGARGGDVGYFRRGDLAQAEEFEDLAFSLEMGMVGGPAETPLGFHLLMPTGRDGGRVRVSQILFRTATSGADTLRAGRVAGEIREVLAGGASVADIHEMYDGASGVTVEVETLGPIVATDLRDFYREAIGELAAGETSEVLEIAGGFQVVRLLHRVAARDPSFEEVEPHLTDLLARRKMEEAYRTWVDKLKEEIYIKIINS
ncbi:MAG: peptidylprolyl isomerase [Candidatus Eisenbacteria sp.]|nr:peptidylprolyl isomerase [Candidatus Eisenbacteria bacterium]